MQNGMIMYNYIGEYVALLLAGLLMFVMIYSKPKKTFVYKYLFYGTIWAIVAILLQIAIFMVANDFSQPLKNRGFMALLILFLMVYNGVLFYIFAYVNMMSMVRRSQEKEFLALYCVLTVIYIMGIVIEIIVTGLYSVTMEGIDLTHFVRFYCGAGLICTVFVFYASVINRPNISRVIWHTVCIMCPLIAAILVGQIVAIGAFRYVFSSITYVLAFTLAFLLFHNIPYDEMSGCQSTNALDEFLKKNIGKKKFYMMYVEFRMPSSEGFINEPQEINLVGVNACRSIEKIDPKISMYRLDRQKFVNIIDVSDQKKALSIGDQIRGVLDGVKAELKVPFNYMVLLGEVTPELDTPMKVRQLNEYAEKKFSDQNNSYYYILQPEDYDSFAEFYDISVTLKDIRDKLDLDDDRVQVYAQPIYSVEQGAFRVAEALMRLKIGDKLVSPDMFIPVAELSGCVHALTCIILNKVCRVVESLEEYYDFDAISINVSSKELSHPEMYQDFLDIIERYDIDVSKIRMEITETAMFENYELANRNMEILNKEGIQLYLDDFGTGYSSLERVINCPVKTIKFDKTLLYKSLDDDRMDDIMAYMIEVLKKNGFVTLVEGVEDESQSQYSMNRGFDYIQGYHYAKPGPIEDLKKFFTRKNTF